MVTAQNYDIVTAPEPEIDIFASIGDIFESTDSDAIFIFTVDKKHNLVQYEFEKGAKGDVRGKQMGLIASDDLVDDISNQKEKYSKLNDLHKHF